MEVRQVDQAFRNHQQLQQFVLADVSPTGRLLGAGSYGSVVEVKYHHLLCAAKKLHEALIVIDNAEVMIQKFLQECQLMSSLRHPNITQFLGLCFLPGTQLPLLIMERLETSLHDLLEQTRNLPLSVKCSVLEDIASGLLYLHERPSPVIHRDLTARNVLLTSSVVAKITDMGNSRIIDMRPGQMASTLTKAPGTLVYMPPEALDDRHRYGSPLDIFSFGHLALFTAIQEFPCNLLPSTYCSPDDVNNVQARNELERRGKYVDRLEGEIGFRHPGLVELIKQCLHNAPRERPNTDELLGRLRQLKVEVEGGYGVSLIDLDIARMKLDSEMKMKDRRIADLVQQNENHQAEQERMTREVEGIRRELEDKDRCIEDLRDEVQTSNQEVTAIGVQEQQYQGTIEAQNGTIREQEVTIQTLRTQVEVLEGIQPISTHLEQIKRTELRVDSQSRMEDGISQLKSQLQSKDAENRKLREELRKCYMSMQQRAADQVPRMLQLDLTWRSGPDIPMETRGYVQSVVIQGMVYVGGGHLGRGTIDKHIVMEYNLRSENWAKLPPYRACDFAITTIKNQLVLVGGEERDHKIKKVGLWRADNNEWTHPYPEMLTARSDSSAVVYKEWLIVAGGISSDFGVAVSCVEVLNIDNKQWYTGPPTPTSWAYMRGVVVGDTGYFMGGSTGKIGPLSGIITDKAYGVSLPTLIGQLNSRNSRDRDRQIRKEMWRKIHGLQIGCSTPLSIGGSLLVAGGRKDKEASTALHLFQPDTGLWVRVGDLPTPRYDCICTMMSDREMLVAGGYCHGMLKNVDIALVNWNT